MSKQVTRWVGKERLYCSFWDAKKPKPSFSNKEWFVDINGDAYGEGHIMKILLFKGEALLPAIKEMKTGELRKIRIILED